jgi:hypothetical protein
VAQQVVVESNFCAILSFRQINDINERAF